MVEYGLQKITCLLLEQLKQQAIQDHTHKSTSLNLKRNPPSLALRNALLQLFPALPWRTIVSSSNKERRLTPGRNPMHVPENSLHVKAQCLEIWLE